MHRRQPRLLAPPERSEKHPNPWSRPRLRVSLLCALVLLTARSESAASGVESVIGTWKAAPTRVPADSVVDGPVLGNGHLAVMVGGQPQSLSFHFGMNSFARTAGMTSAALPWGPAVPGGVDLSCPIFENASYSAAQHIANGTVTTEFSKPGVGVLDSSSFVRPVTSSRVHLVFTSLVYHAAPGAPGSIPLGIAVRAGPLKSPDPYLICGPSSATTSLLTTQRAAGEDWQSSYGKGRPRLGEYGRNLTRVAMGARVFTARGDAVDFINSSATSSGASGAIVLESGQQLLLVMAVGNNRDIEYDDIVAAVTSTLVQSRMPITESVALARQENAVAWRQYYNKSSLYLPHSPLTERFFYSSLYLLQLAAGSGESGSPGLYGPFVTVDRMAWGGDIHLNYNAEATYYGALQAGHEELLASYYRPLLDYRKWARIWARELFNCRGLHLPTGIAPYGNPADGGGWNDNGQRSNGLFAALHFSSSFLFLRPRNASMLFDYVAETIEFWEDYLVLLNESIPEKGLKRGEYVVLNDCFQEMCGVPDGFGGWPWNIENINNQLTLAYLKYHLDALSEMATEGYGTVEQATRWQEIREHLPQFPTTNVSITYNNCTHSRLVQGLCPPSNCGWVNNGTDPVGCKQSVCGPCHWQRVYVGVVGAGAEPPGSNPVELSAIFPGSDVIGFSSTPDELNIARQTVQYKDAWLQMNGFPQVFASAGRVFYGHEVIPSLRMGGDVLMRTFERVIRDSMVEGNMWHTEGGGGLETLGGLAYVCEALLQSHEGFVRLFPGGWHCLAIVPWVALNLGCVATGLPPAEEASFKGFRARGGFVVGASRNIQGDVIEFEVLSEAGRDFSFVDANVAFVQTQSGTPVKARRVNIGRETQVWQFSTIAGERYNVRIRPRAWKL